MKAMVADAVTKSLSTVLTESHGDDGRIQDGMELDVNDEGECWDLMRSMRLLRQVASPGVIVVESRLVEMSPELVHS